MKASPIKTHILSVGKESRELRIHDYNVENIENTKESEKKQQLVIKINESGKSLHVLSSGC